MKSLFLLLSCLLVLISCESTHLSSNSANGAGQPADALRVVAGLWQFSHAGPPSIQTSDLQSIDVVELTTQQLRGSKISIGENGSASLTSGGNSQSFRVKIVEETPIFIKIRCSKDGTHGFYIYDKTDKLMVIQAPITVNEDSEGTLPLYYKRI